ncbi:alpha/beta fold hydrolase [Pseudoduganella sp. DS3]|uniref:Alpha/beta fold hydrolase n=1 Tax=Pseudoduganella guangdongensis TaxID=2692179 RepID=A0A6N9HCI5_9BURK|nr:alpha/beta fold hydrolase [Pseudoduganella guangdongensis]MYN00723.1 alpha/beta fold hydrolase [Pseudoduganella guangdongensis]
MFKYLLLSLAAVGSLAHAAPPAQHFFSQENFKAATISPSGRYVALLVGDGKTRDGMLVLDSATRKAIGGARLDDSDIGDVRWVNDQRLVFTITDKHEAAGARRFAPGLFGINRDGKELRRLADRDNSREGVGSNVTARVEPPNTFLMKGAGAQDSDFLYVLRPIWENLGHAKERVDLVKLDTVRGGSTTVSRPAPALSWMLDHTGEPSIMLSIKGGVTTIHYRDPASGKWRDLTSSQSYGSADFEPIGFHNEKNMLVIARRKGDKDTLHVLDMTTGAIDPQPLVALGDFDFAGTVVYSRKRLMGIHYNADARTSLWFDPGMKAAQEEVDKLLTATVNIITPPTNPETPWLLVSAYSDRQPNVFMLFNRDTKELATLGSSHPDINPAEMGTQSMVKVKARDGLEFPAWLTTPPKQDKQLPLVVLVHGGPYIRGTSWGWNPEVQFLASRGYAVLQPEFRGSTGYGDKLYKAGLKQWGLKMQDDIADSVKWAVAQGVADPRRICIMGASYGGYATLMGLVNDGDMYRCGVSWAAVTDLPLLLETGSVLTDTSDEYLKYGAPELIGDLAKDAAQLAATSPVKQAARIKRPLLLAHGSDDARVPFAHYTRMRGALKDSKADVEFAEYVGEVHGWSKLDNAVDFWTRVEKFLDKHIGAKAKVE